MQIDDHDWPLIYCDACKRDRVAAGDGDDAQGPLKSFVI
jgi:hypothetical protein